ncbi:TIR domain-containing protein [Flexithrix dorotheae]|uniref:TIR domain-containing protein n=1 Tax=Flexithrix dorotheae TaxID=70993 RepID=UPI0003743E71|nr:TIR domain-containing protein [Flexithrix dorotheae]
MNTTLAIDIYDAFISYGRNESKAMAIRLKKELEKKNYRVWLDQDDIELGVDFQKRIDEGIAQSHNFIYIIAPHSNKSQYCRKEIELALHYSKRIIPILHVERNLEALHPKIAELNWLYMREEENHSIHLEDWKAIDDFGQGTEQLCGLMERGKSFIKEHTRLLNQALSWEKHQRSPQYLPVGKEREKVEKWLLSTLREDVPCQPSPLHCEYISETRKNGENMMTDVFIAYDNKDQKYRKKINHSLMRHGFTTWVDQSDIKVGDSYQEAIFEGIEQANNLIFLLSPKSVKSEFCLKELKHALSLNKRIIPLMVDKVEEEDIPQSIRHIQHVDFTDNNENRELKSKKDKSDYEKDIDELIIQLREDENYIHKHKQFLVQALRWESLDRSDSILLRGFNLEEAEGWLKAGLKRRENLPVQLHQDFITASKAKIGQLKTEVFISYSRKDADFARKLNNKLQVYGKTTWFDQESIAEGSDFAKEILKGIESSDNFLFIISPDSIDSEYCEKEVIFASELNKRFIPIIYRKTNESAIPEALKKVQWIDFEGKDFDATFGKLVFTLDTDREYVQSHTKWQRRSVEWMDRDKSDDLLLRGKELEVARSWLESALEEQKQPLPTSLHQHYIHASEDARLLLLKKEEERKKEMEKILQEKREEEIKRLEKEKASRKQRRMIYLLLFLFLATVGLSILAYFKSKEAAREAEIAEKAAIEARIQKEEAEKQRAEAEKQRLEADRQRRETERQKVKVDSALDLALQQFMIAEYQKEQSDSLRLVAENKRQEAEQQKDRANLKSKEANEQRKLAEKNAKEAKDYSERLKKVSEALSLVTYMAEKSLSVDDPTTKSLIALHARKIHQDYQGPQFDPDIYNALYEATKAVNKLEYNSFPVFDDRTTISGLKTLGNQCFITGYNGSMGIWGWDTTQNVLGKNEKTIYTRPVLFKGKAQNIRVTQKFFNEALNVSANKEWAAFANEDGNNVYLYHVSSKQETKLEAHSAKISSIAFSFNNEKLYSASLGGKIYEWEVNSKSKKLHYAHQEGIQAIGTLPNGDVIFLDVKGKLYAKPSNGNKKPQLLYSDLVADIGTSLTVNPKGTLIAAGFASGKIVLLDLKKSKNYVSYLYGHQGVVKDITFSGDGQFLASVSLDGKVLLRHLASLDNKPREMHDDFNFAHAIAFNPDSKYLLVSSESKIRAYPVDMDMMAENLCEQLDRKAFTEDEWEKFGLKILDYESIKICE